MFRFILGSLLLSLGVLAPDTGWASRRAALLIDAATGDSGASAAPITELANVLKTGFGFDLVRFGQGDFKDLSAAVSEFRRRTKGSEVSVVYFSGELEHDSTGTFLRTTAPGSASGVRLDDLLQDLVNGSTASIVVLEDRGSHASSSGRYPGFGRMPVVDKLLIALGTAPSNFAKGPATLVEALAAQLGKDEIHPDAMLNSVRDSVYVQTAGRAVIRLFGTLPGSFIIERGPYRAGAISGIRSRIHDLCQTAGAASVDDAALLTLLDVNSKGSRVASLEDLDSYRLAALHEEMLRAPSCPFGKTPSPEHETPPAKKDEPVAALPPPATPTERQEPEDAATETKEQGTPTSKEKDEEKAKGDQGTGVAAIPPETGDRDEKEDTREKPAVKKRRERRADENRTQRKAPSGPARAKPPKRSGPVNIPSF